MGYNNPKNQPCCNNTTRFNFVSFCERGEGESPLEEVGVVAPVTAVFEGTAPAFYVTYPLSRWSLLFYMLIEGGEPS